MPYSAELPSLWAGRYRNVPHIPLSVWNSCCPSSPETARYLTYFHHHETKHYIKPYNILNYRNNFYCYIIHQNPLMKICYRTGMELTQHRDLRLARHICSIHDSSYLVWQGTNYLNTKNVLQQKSFTTCMVVPSLSPLQHCQQKSVTFIAKFSTAA